MLIAPPPDRFLLCIDDYHESALNKSAFNSRKIYGLYCPNLITYNIDIKHVKNQYWEKRKSFFLFNKLIFVKYMPFTDIDNT